MSADNFSVCASTLSLLLVYLVLMKQAAMLLLSNGSYIWLAENQSICMKLKQQFYLYLKRHSQILLHITS